MEAPSLPGPPPDPRQVLLDLGPLAEPGAWLACLVAGGVLVASGVLLRRTRLSLRAFLVILGQVVALTAPLAAVLERAVLGAWPGIDKTGSYLFYLDGVHRRLLLHPVDALADPAVRLIGVHLGHLWVTEALDLVLSAHGAFNAQGILYPALGWTCAWLLLRETRSGPREALIAAFPFGMGLHVFRDLQWATVEKAAVFGIPLFAWALLRASRRGGAWVLAAAGAFAGAAWLNWYLALVNGILAVGLLLALRDRRTAVAVGGSLAAALPLVAWQALVLPDAGPMADRDRWLWERAALDVLSLWPPAWYRLEPWRALNLGALGLAFGGLWRERRDRRVQVGLLVGLGLAMLSLGPLLAGTREAGIPNPIYWLAWTLVPGFWRIAKPEFLFEGTWLLLLVLAGRTLTSQHLRRPALLGVHAVVLAAWVASVRTHPAYPVFTAPVEVRLPSGWAEEVEAP